MQTVWGVYRIVITKRFTVTAAITKITTSTGWSKRGRPHSFIIIIIIIRLVQT